MSLSLLVFLLHPLYAAEFTTAEAWGYGMLASVGVSVIGVICSAIVVAINQKARKKFAPGLKIMLAFAGGALLGDAVIHLITEATGHWENSLHEEISLNRNLVNLVILSGFCAFLLLEKILVLTNVIHVHRLLDESDDKSTEKQSIRTHNECECHQPDVNVDQNERQSSQSEQPQMACDVEPKDEEMPPVLAHVSPDISKKGKFAAQWRNKLGAGWMNLLGELFHNLMDGIAIGAAFATKDHLTATSTLIAIICHEIPQELGDVGVLLMSGFTNMQALILNSLIGLIAIVGAAIGLGLGGINEEATRYITAFIAGTFIYLSAVNIMPLVCAEHHKGISVGQYLAVWAGIAVMYSLILLETDEH